ncbi:MAG: efflux RND transporter periplasmic adaptor subunit, partial [Verrucomicrobiota bacterium]
HRFAMISPVSSIIPFCLLALSVPLNAADKVAVRTVLPVISTAPAKLELPGRTEPLEAATIFTRATGIVRERKFDIGDHVQAGEELAMIDVPDVDRAVEAARATVDQASARAKTARQVGNRAAALLSAHAVSKDESENRLSVADESEAALQVAKAELARLEVLQQFATVRAPFDGTIAARNFDRGDRMRGDSATSEGWLYKLVRLDALRFVVNATPDLALRLATETAAKVRFTELPGRVFTAKLARTSRTFDTTSGTMRAEFLIANEDLSLPAGLTGLAVFSLPPVPGTFSVPANTLILRQGNALVAVVRDGKVSYVEVLPGKNSGVTIEITSAALTPEAPVIVNPNALLREGDPVEVTASRAGQKP